MSRLMLHHADLRLRRSSCDSAHVSRPRCVDAHQPEEHEAVESHRELHGDRAAASESMRQGRRDAGTPQVFGCSPGDALGDELAHHDRENTWSNTTTSVMPTAEAVSSPMPSETSHSATGLASADSPKMPERSPIHEWSRARGWGRIHVHGASLGAGNTPLSRSLALRLVMSATSRERKGPRPRPMRITRINMSNQLDMI